MNLIDIMEQPYPQTAGYRVTGTSQDAARSIDAAGLRAKVLAVLRDRPATADECAARLGMDRLSIRPRLSELKLDGKVRDSGLRRRNASNKNALVWVLAGVT
jgi:predicted Rossmann fold nucleotide-binding protein DprA/Smf involved in DNA uptake